MHGHRVDVGIDCFYYFIHIRIILQERDAGEQADTEKLKATEKSVRWRKRDHYGRLIPEKQPSAGGLCDFTGFLSLISQSKPYP